MQSVQAARCGSKKFRIVTHCNTQFSQNLEIKSCKNIPLIIVLPFSVYNSPGLMGRDVSIVATGMKALLESQEMFSLDKVISPIPWRDELYLPSSTSGKKHLTIGWYDHDNFIQPTPCSMRAVNEAKDALERAGHKLVQFTPPDISEVWEMMCGIFTADQGKFTLNELSGEILDQSIETNKKLLGLHWSLRAVVRPIISIKSPIVSKMATSK